MLRLDLHASARTLLWGVALAASIVTIAAYAAVATTEYDHSLLLAETTSENTARLLEEHALRTFDASLVLLDRLSERVEEVGLLRIGASDTGSRTTSRRLRSNRATVPNMSAMPWRRLPTRRCGPETLSAGCVILCPAAKQSGGSNASPT